MKTIKDNGYRYNEYGTAWVIEQVRFDDFGGGVEPNTAEFMVLNSFPSYDKAHEYFMNFCSGLQDDEGICSGQNFSKAYFYRIVEVQEGFAR